MGKQRPAGGLIERDLRRVHDLSQCGLAAVLDWVPAGVGAGGKPNCNQFFRLESLYRSRFARGPLGGRSNRAIGG